MTVVVLMLIYLERKIAGTDAAAARADARGPVRPAADAGGHGEAGLTKEDLRPAGANRWVFELAVFAIFVPAFLAFVAIPFTRRVGGQRPRPGNASTSSPSRDCHSSAS